VGVAAFGLGIEANPIVAGLMAHLGHGPGLLSAKVMAVFLGICLHLREVHLAVAMLTGFYAAAAVAPWALILFF
jgi:siroheme synthase